MFDQYGFEITKEGNTYTRQGVVIVSESDEQALNTFNAMLPDGYTPPLEEPQQQTPDEVLDQIKALMEQYKDLIS